MEPKKEEKKQEESKKGESGSYKQFLDNEQVEKSLDKFRHRLGMSTNEQKKSDEKEDLKSQSEENRKKIEELTDTLKRLQAEFENYKKRADKERAEFMKYANAGVIAQLLPVLDSFDIALKSTADKEKFIEGIKIIYAQLYSVLEAEGLMPIKTAGEKFDPYRHEVLMKEESNKPEETILEDFQKGYILKDRVLRHSKVKISGK